ncbi:hypothetical protein AAT19DRAFT_13110 [Rhodotorula toruloides]|uniref:Proteophosphoglycan ppg4 n=1 Tax=Rhodotorula toruloides TaxID=5286 RepID=A0A2T0ADK9_RHOTO|nr:hypothetical protein AAT19DRAFT_13110 [Rhodotorula toruloides]
MCNIPPHAEPDASDGGSVGRLRRLPFAHLLLRGFTHPTPSFYLKIRHDARGEPVDDFSFERDVPSLRKLDITAYGSLAACAPGLSKLTHLTISSTEFAAAAIPWETLHYLDIGLLDLGEPDFIDSLQDVCKDSVCPRSQPPSLTAFKIHGIDSFADSKSWTFSARLPSVLHLKLGGCSNYDTTVGPDFPCASALSLTACDEQDALRGLRAFLDLCPAAQSLRLIGFQYYPDNPTNPRPVPSAAKEAILGSIRDKNLPFAFPAISALLFLLLQTSILDVYLELSTNGGIRWRRASCSEVFEGERWTVI